MNKQEAENCAKEMTYRDAVNNALRGKCIPYRKATLIKLYELLDIIKSLQSESCEDTISQSAVIKVISDKKAKHIDDRENNPINYGTLLDLERDIRTLPSVNPTPELSKIRAEIKELYRDRPNSYNHPQRTEFYAGVLAIIGKYKAESNSEMLVCPACGLDVHSHFKTCPRCGVKMESEDKE